MPHVIAFLKNHIETSMFPLSNYAREGLGSDYPYASAFWFAQDDTGVTDVVAHSNNGSMFPQIRKIDPRDVAATFMGAEITGLLGATDQVEALRAAFGFHGKAKLDAAEPHFNLSLADLYVPPLDNAELIPMVDADRDLMIAWRAAYEVEALNETEEAGYIQAVKDVESYIKNDSHRVLMLDGEPVSTTGFNAVLPNCVQIGGVYTPPELRGLGYARTAVAWHLYEAKNNGVTDSILFAASEAAAKAYIAIGFRQIGQFSIVIYDDPQVFHA